MKHTTARRLLKEQGHPEELIKKAKATIAEYDRKVAAGLAAEAEIAQHAREQQAKAPGLELVPAGMTYEEFARRQVKSVRHGELSRDWAAYQKGKSTPHMKLGPDGKPILGPDGQPIMNFDSMGNKATK
jgi:hypothetical protein